MSGRVLKSVRKKRSNKNRGKETREQLKTSSAQLQKVRSQQYVGKQILKENKYRKARQDE